MVQGKSYKIEILDRDSESNSNTAATAAQDLISKDGVNVMLVAQTPDTTVPVVQQATNNEIPVLSNNAPWQPHYLGIGGKLGPGIDPPVASEWNYHFFWGLEDVIEVFTSMWNDVKPGAVVGGLWPDDPDGNAWSDPNVGFPPALKKAGFTVVDPGRFPLGGSDYSAQINAFKNGGRRDRDGRAAAAGLRQLLGPGPAAGPQADRRHARQGAPLPGRGGLVTRTRSACRRRSGGRTSTRRRPASPGRPRPIWPGPTRTQENKQWTQPIGYVHSLFEVIVDAIVRAGGVKDKQALLDAIGETNAGHHRRQGGLHQAGRAPHHQDAARRRPVGRQPEVGRGVQDRHQHGVPGDPDATASSSR